MARGLRTITVRELLDLLEGESPDMRIIVTADYGDHSHTAQALPLKGEFETVTVSESAYSSSGFAIAEPDDDDEEDAETFLVLR